MISACILAVAAPLFGVTHARRGGAKLLVKHAVKPVAKPKFQTPRGIEDGRATQIQAALIRSGYLTGEPTGHWDSASEAAMQKLQGDNGWQTKLVPDSRAIIRLGLGPSTDSASAESGPAWVQPPRPVNADL